MIILAIDPGSNTGYCLIEVNKKVANIYGWGQFEVDKTSHYQGDWCISVMDWLEGLVDLHEVNHIVIEDYFFNRFSAMGGSLNIAFRAALWIRARDLELPYTIISIGSWKKFIAGRTRPDKPLVRKYGKELSKKIMIQEALWKKWGIKFSNFSIGKKGKVCKPNMDLVDAVGQALFYCHEHLKVDKVTTSVKIDEADLSKVKWKYYKY